MKRKIATIAAGVMLFHLSAIAHHSVGVHYDLSKEIEFEGKVVEVLLRSPHSFFFVEAKDEVGKMQKWSIEGAGVAQFAQQGVTPATFNVGDYVKIVGNPAHNKTTYRARLVKITRPSDGKSWGGRAGEVVD